MALNQWQILQEITSFFFLLIKIQCPSELEIWDLTVPQKTDPKVFCWVFPGKGLWDSLGLVALAYVQSQKLWIWARPRQDYKKCREKASFWPC